MEKVYKNIKKPIEYIGVGLSSILFLVLHLRLYDEILGAPYTKGGDADFHYIMVRTIQKTGWIFDNPQLGSPKSSTIYDVPQGGDNFHWLAMKIISYFTSAVQTVNLYFILSFALVSIAAYGASRWWGLARISSYVIAILYAFLPYHFYRGQNHLLLSMYFVIPLVIVFAFKSCSSNEKINRYLLIAFSALVASTGAYYFIFSLLLFIIAIIFNLINKNRHRIKQQLIFVGVSMLVFIFNQLPTIIYILKNGSNSSAAVRNVADAESYGLQITDMFMPRVDHRIPKFASLANIVYSSGIPSEAGQSIGIVASLGVIGLLLFGITKIIQSNPIPEKFKYFLITLPVIIFFTVSSGPTLVLGILGFTQIRSWNRVVVIIAFIGLLCFGYFSESIKPKLKMEHANYAFVAIMILILIVGFFDLTSNADKFSSKANYVTMKKNCDFVKAIEKQNAKNNNVFQFPYIKYPEGGDINELKHYDQAMYILCDANLDYSFGAMVGRDDQLQEKIASKKVLKPEDIAKLKSNKFSIIEIDRNGYKDYGKAIEKLLIQEFGEPILNADGSNAAYIID